MKYTTFESDHTSHDAHCGCDQTKRIPELNADQLAFERWITEEFCSHLRKDPELFCSTQSSLLMKSTVPSYETAYFHQDIHYMWLGWRAHLSTMKNP